MKTLQFKKAIVKKPYTLNEEQKKIFNDAMQDISLRIGSIHLT